MTDPAKTRSNGAGKAGLILGVLGLFSAGLFSPHAILCSFVGLFRAPRKAATWGLILGILGLVELGAVAGVGVAMLAAKAQNQHMPPGQIDFGDGPQPVEEIDLDKILQDLQKQNGAIPVDSLPEEMTEEGVEPSDTDAPAEDPSGAPGEEAPAEESPETPGEDAPAGAAQPE